MNTRTAGQLTAAFKTTAFNIIFHPLSDVNPGYEKAHGQIVRGPGETIKGRTMATIRGFG